MSRVAIIPIAVLAFLVGSLVYANEPPVADAGEDQSIYLYEFVVLDGSAEDPDGDPIVAWHWEIEEAPEGSAAELSDPDVPNPLFIPDLEGDYFFSLIASDGDLWSLPDTVVISVTLNLPPTAIINADTTEGEAPLTVHFDGTESFDPEEGPLTYFWLFDDGMGPSYDSIPTHEFILPGNYQVQLKVTDDMGQWDFDYLNIKVLWPDAAVTPQPDNRAQKIWLSPCRPNPFHHETVIRFHVPEHNSVSVLVLDVSGAVVRRVAEGSYSAGPHRVVWDGLDDAGHPVGPGVYFYQLRVDGQVVDTRKTIVLR